MRISKLLVLVFTLLITSKLFLVSASENNLPSPHRYIVTFKGGVGESKRDAAVSNFQGRLGKKFIRRGAPELNERLSKINSIVIETSNINTFEMRVQALLVPEIASIEPDASASKFGSTNDPDLSKEWGLYTMKVASSSGTSAWDTTTGIPSVKVAVLDTGVNNAHPDLSGVVVLSKDFTGSQSGSNDKDGHGSHVAGAIAGAGNNNLGIAGVSYGVGILNGKVLNDNGSGYYSWIASGIIWAADNGAKVINMSLGGSVDSLTLDNAIDYAIGKGVVVVAAAGNSIHNWPE